ncbi:ABC transporter permease subunit [Vibrio sp. RC27]
MLTNSIYQEEHIPTQFERFWRSFKHNNLAMFGLWCMILLLIIIAVSPWITPHNPIAPSEHLLLPPSWDPTGSIDYFLGTDDLGRDILSRLIAGTRHSFGYALLVTLVALCIGGFIGILAGMTSGLLSSVLNHLFDTVMSIPSLLLAVIFVAVLGPGETNVLLAIGLALTPRFIRSLYTAINTEMAKDYIMAARLDGASDIYLLLNSILPNILTVIALETTLAITIAILDITALGFLNLGAQAPTTEWGAMLGSSVELLYLAPWTVILPGLMIMFTIVVVNLVGEGARQALNSGVE